jgi:hypothetical protein
MKHFKTVFIKVTSNRRRTSMPSLFSDYHHSLEGWYNYSACFKLNVVLLLLFLYSLVCYWFRWIDQSCGSTMDRPQCDVIFHLWEASTASFRETNKKSTVGSGCWIIAFSTTNTNKKRDGGVNMLFAFQIIRITSLWNCICILRQG